MQTKTRPGGKTKDRTSNNGSQKTQRRKVEEEITDRIIELLDQGGLPPWSKGWRNSPSTPPMNAVSMKPYRGVNRWMTLLTQHALSYDDPRWLTYRQAEALGGNVRKGEKSTAIVFWKRVSFRDRDEGENQDYGKDNNGSPPEEGRTRTYPMLRSYRVFNLEQTENCQIKPLPRPETADHDPIRAAEAIIAGMPGPPAFRFYENANYAPHYRPGTDTVHIPALDRFQDPESYYGTVFHELAHATGHPKRLERFGLDANANDLHAYGREELTAAMGAAMLAAHAGIAPALVEMEASYIRHWRDVINADKAMVIRAATLAQRAVDLILGESPPEFTPEKPEVQPETQEETP